MALNKGSSISVKLLSFGAYFGILRELVISLKCLMNISANLPSSDTISFCSIIIIFLASITNYWSKRSDSFQKLFLLTLAACILLKYSLHALFLILTGHFLAFCDGGGGGGVESTHLWKTMLLLS